MGPACAIGPKIDRIPILPEAAAALPERLQPAYISGNPELLRCGQVFPLGSLLQETFKMPVDMAIVPVIHALRIGCPQGCPLCGRGQRGCLESYAGTKGILRMAQAACAKYPKSVLANLINTEEFSVSLLSKAAAQDDEVALNLWKEIGAYLGRGLADMVLLLNPNAIVLAGGVSRGAKYFLPSVKEVFEKQAVKTPFKNVKILLSKEGNIGGVGAALYALHKANEK